MLSKALSHYWHTAGNKIDARPLAIASWIFCGRVLPIYHSPTLASSSFIVLTSFKVNFIENLKYLESFSIKFNELLSPILFTSTSSTAHPFAHLICIRFLLSVQWVCLFLAFVLLIYVGFFAVLTRLMTSQYDSSLFSGQFLQIRYQIFCL